MSVFSDARNRRAFHILDPEAHLVQQTEKARAARVSISPGERMHFHEDRAGTLSLLSQDFSRTFENLLLEALDVDLDHIDSLAGKRVVERHHRHRNHAVANLGTDFNSRLLSARRGKADLSAALTNGGSDYCYPVLPAVDGDVGFQSRCAIGIGFERRDVACCSDASRERQR